MESEYMPGKHLLLDLWGCKGLTDLPFIKQVLEEAAHVCGATVLETKLHKFGETGGVTGVAILAESHISIHTWPEISFAALDVFMCGACDPCKSIDVFNSFFSPEKTSIKEYGRGLPSSKEE